MNRRSLIAAAGSFILLPSLGNADDWAQWRGSGRDGDWTESDVIREFKEGDLKTLWRQPISSGYTGPTVSKGRVFVMDRVSEPKQIERVLCFEEATGKPLWSHAYDAVYQGVGYTAGPRASVTVDDSRAYSLGTMGHLNCFDVESGKPIWSRDLDADYQISKTKRMPIWGIAGSPLIYEDSVIIHLGGNNNACIVAFNKTTGEEKWRSMEDRGQYSSPILHQADGRTILICWTADHVAGLNPSDGKVHWKIPMKPKNMPIGVATPLVKDNHVFVTSFYDGSMMIRMSEDGASAEKVWSLVGKNERSTKALHSIISTPVWLGDYIYGVDSYGEFRCLSAKDGTRLWESDKAVPKARWSTVHFVQNGSDTWMFNERGELCVYVLSPEAAKEVSRAKVIEPTEQQLRRRKGVCWSHPAFANRRVYLRNDKEIICIDLAKK